MTKQEIEELAELFKALGDPSRLKVFELLRAGCCAVAVDGATGDVRPVDGVTVGAVCCVLPIAPATVSQHLKQLRQAGLIVTERDGKFIRCGVDPRALTRLAGYFARPDTNCCDPQQEENEHGRSE